MRLYLFLMLTGLTLFSCKQGPQEIKVYSSEGKLEKKYFIDKDSLQQGTQLTFYNNGRDIFERAEYVDGQLEGKRILYFESGQPEVIENYKNNILTDTLYLYYPSGALKMTAYYQKGIHTGVNTTYFENGIVKEKVQFVNNEENGPFTEYYENGRIHWQGQYLNGDNEIGELIEYGSTGNLIKRMICDSLSVCRTVWSAEKGDINASNEDPK